MKTPKTYSKFFDSTLAISLLTFSLYLISALYMKGYLGFFGADAAWFSPSIFQLITLGIFPIGASISLVFLFVFLSISQKNPLASEAEQAAHDMDRHEGKTNKEKRELGWIEFKSNWKKEIKKIPVMAVWFYAIMMFIIFFVASGAQALVGLETYLSEKNKPFLYMSYFILAFIILFCLAGPPTISFLVTRSRNEKKKRKKDLENQIASLYSILQNDTENIQAKNDLQKATQNLDGVNKYLSPKKTLSMDIFSALLLFFIILFASFISGLAAASKDWSDFNEFQSINLEKTRKDGSGTPTWIIFTDGRNQLTYEENLSTNGFYYRSSESKIALKLNTTKKSDQLKKLNDELLKLKNDATKSQMSYLASMIKEWGIIDGKLPDSLPQLKDKLKSIEKELGGFDPLIDAWKNQIKYKPSTGSAELISRGADYEFGTKDDIQEKIILQKEESPSK